MAKSSFYNTNPATNDLIIGADLLASTTAAKLAAEAAATQAGAYAATASASLNLIYASANTAIDAATLASSSASASAALASLKADEAQASAADAAAGVSLIGGYATAASASATASATSAMNSETSKVGAFSAAFSANADSISGALSADAAYDSEQAALASQTAAASSASAAANSATAAFNSVVYTMEMEANVTASAANAATSETNALASKNAAATSATNAATSEGNALTYRGDTLTYRNQAETFKNAAANSAIAAATFDPALFMPKTGGAFSGAITISGQTPWTDTTLPTTTFGRSVANAADANAARTLVGGTRNYAGAISATNGMTAGATESGLFYSMALSSGVQTFNLPSTSGLPDGFSCIVRAGGTPSGYQTSYVAASSGVNVVYRNVSANRFHLIGQNEVFRFTWMSGLAFWIAECLCQPGPVEVTSSYTSAAYNGGFTAFTRVPLNVMSGSFSPCFSLSSSQVQVPVTGVWSNASRVYMYASDGVNHVGYLVLGDPNTTTYNTQYGYDIKTILGGSAMYVGLTASMACAAGAFMHAYMLMDSASLYYYLSNTAVNVNLVAR